MVHLKKKIRLEPSHANSSVSTTHIGQTLNDLLNWLITCGTVGLEDGRFDFQNSVNECGGSLGGFAARNFFVGDVLFSIPLICLISVSNANDSEVTKLVRDAAVALGDSKLVTSELLIWLFMIQQLADSDGHFHAFVRSLDPQSPSPLSWPDNLTSTLLGTNMSTMTNSSSSVERHAQFLDDVRIWASENGRDCSFIGADNFNITSLIWARGHYLARRYPGTFSSLESYEKSLLPTTIDLEQIDTNGDGREQGMMNLGALVPLLDILNHNPEREWLTFKVSDGFLHVTCNYPIKKGSEIYSNYGSLSNEMLLYAYGFCLETNLDDAVTLQLMGLDLDKGEGDSNIGQGSARAKHFGTFYVQRGGMDGIPSELWQQLTALIGNDRDEEDEGSDGDEEEEEEQSTAVNDPPLRAGRREETPVSDSKHDTDGGDEKEEREAEAEGKGEGEEVDESDDELPVEIGLDECMMLKECLEKKLASLVSTEESASKTLATFDDPRAQYVKWYRAGQVSIMTETIEALSEAIDGCES